MNGNTKGNNKGYCCSYIALLAVRSYLIQLSTIRSKERMNTVCRRFQHKYSRTHSFERFQAHTADLDIMFSSEIQSTPFNGKINLVQPAESSRVLAPGDRIRQLEKLQESFTGYASELGKDVKFLLAIETPIAKTIMSFTVGPQHTNRFANLHGSCTAAIFQIGTLSALALVARKGHWSNLGAGRSMRVTYLKPVEEGDGCWVTSEVVCVGKRMCKCLVSRDRRPSLRKL